MPSYGSLHSPSLRKMNGNMDGKGRRTASMRGMSMDNILGDPFALATISIASVSHTLFSDKKDTDRVAARMDHCLHRIDSSNGLARQPRFPKLLLVRHRLHVLCDCRNLCGYSFGHSTDLSCCDCWLPSMRTRSDQFLCQLSHIFLKWV